MNTDPNRNVFLDIVERRPDIEGRFVSCRRIDPTGGNGNFSLIFTSMDTQTDRQVVLKFYHPNQRHDPYRWASFRREAKVLESLAGQKDIIGFVAPQSEFIESLPVGNGTFQIQFAYYAMEMAASDMGIITAMGSWDAERVLSGFHAMCRAVQRLHARRIAHRDLKPRNFLVSTCGEVKLSDFGTARQIDHPADQLLPNYSAPPGDLRYAAPEMLACVHDDDPSLALKADIFSLGAILFEMFTGLTLLPLVLDQNSINDLVILMYNVRKGQRFRVYDGFVSAMANTHPLPDIAATGAIVRPSVCDRIDRLYKSMAAIDYRSRLCDFDRIFLQIQSCLLVLRNEEKFRRWRDEKRRRRMISLNKVQRLGVKR